jgi:hypothetical protein
MAASAIPGVISGPAPKPGAHIFAVPPGALKATAKKDNQAGFASLQTRFFAYFFIPDLSGEKVGKKTKETCLPKRPIRLLEMQGF